MQSFDTNNENSDFKDSYHKNRDEKTTLSNCFKEHQEGFFR